MSKYDTIGKGYINFRLPDARISQALMNVIQPCKTILNIGAGTGSYELGAPQWNTTAIELSKTMISQRPEKLAPAIQGRAEALPFDDNSFDASMGVLTLHHWDNLKLGLTEALRVCKDKAVFLTWMGPYPDFWLLDYFPEIAKFDDALFPTEAEFRELAGPIQVSPVPIPADCTDGFMCAYWKRPKAYLSQDARNAISTFARMKDCDQALCKLESDLQSGLWSQRYGHLDDLKELDLGYKIVVIPKESSYLRC